MRFYTKQHRYSCGIDLHAKTVYVCILSQDGETAFHRNLPSPLKSSSGPSPPTEKAWWWLTGGLVALPRGFTSESDAD